MQKSARFGSLYRIFKEAIGIFTPKVFLRNNDLR